jgi:membrane associated rhomboid family serine protease
MREPLIRVPAVIVWMIGIFVAVHVLAVLMFPDQLERILLTFAFFPARYDAVNPAYWPGGEGAYVWTFVTYAVLHADFMHLSVNALWLLAFGSAVAWRFGALRMLLLSLVCAVAGSVAHLVTNLHDISPMIGASAVVSGLMAAAVRFVFEMGGPLNVFRSDDQGAFRVQAVSLRELLSSPRILGFMGIWFGINLLLGLSALVAGGQSVAWQAHIGGFCAGLLLFGLFDPVKPPVKPKRPHLRVISRTPPDDPGS